MAALYWNCAGCPGQLTWTKARPTKPGFYFYRYPSGSVVVIHMKRLEIMYNKYSKKVQVLFFNDFCSNAFENLPDGHWAGPIPEPVEVEEVEDADHERGNGALAKNL